MQNISIQALLHHTPLTRIRSRCPLVVQVILVFTNLTWLMVGSSAIEFSSLDEAWQSVIRVSLGESENFYPQILAAQPTFGPIVIVFYQVLGLVLLLNVVIAVLLEVSRR